MGDRGFAWICRQAVLRSEIRFSRLYHGGEPPSVVIMGSSRGVNGFYSPLLSEALKLPVLNLSYNSMSMEIVEALFLDYLDHNAKPVMLVLEITNLGFSEELLNDLKIYLGQSPRLSRMLTRENLKVAYACHLSYLFRYNGEFFLRALYYLNKSDQTWVNHYTITPDMIKKLQLQPKDPEAFPPPTEENIRPLLRILALSQAWGIPVRLIISPYFPEYIRKKTRFQGWKQAIQDRVGHNHRIWDYSVAIADPECFSDRLHLNFRGTQVLQPRLLHDGVFHITP